MLGPVRSHVYAVLLYMGYLMRFGICDREFRADIVPSKTVSSEPFHTTEVERLLNCVYRCTGLYGCQSVTFTRSSRLCRFYSSLLNTDRKQGSDLLYASLVHTDEANTSQVNSMHFEASTPNTSYGHASVHKSDILLTHTLSSSKSTSRAFSLNTDRRTSNTLYKLSASAIPTSGSMSKFLRLSKTTIKTSISTTNKNTALHGRSASPLPENRSMILPSASQTSSQATPSNADNRTYSVLYRQSTSPIAETRSTTEPSNPQNTLLASPISTTEPPHSQVASKVSSSSNDRSPSVTGFTTSEPETKSTPKLSSSSQSALKNLSSSIRVSTSELQGVPHTNTPHPKVQSLILTAFSGEVSWKDAEGLCYQRNQSLVRIKSAEIQANAVKIANSSGLEILAIGLFMNNFHWVYLDFTLVKYSAWAPMQPVGWHGAMSKRHNYLWVGLITKADGYICETRN